MHFTSTFSLVDEKVFPLQKGPYTTESNDIIQIFSQIMTFLSKTFGFLTISTFL